MVQLISADALANYMQRRGYTVRELAQQTGCAVSTIGHLRSGARTQCVGKVAAAIEQALEAPPGSLFTHPKPRN